MWFGALSVHEGPIGGMVVMFFFFRVLDKLASLIIADDLEMDDLEADYLQVVDLEVNHRKTDDYEVDDREVELMTLRWSR